MKSGYVLALALIAELAGACSTALTVSPVFQGDKPNGVIYFLPTVQFDIALTREVTKCDPVTREIVVGEEIGTAERKARVLGLKYGRVNLAVKTNATVMPRYAADGAHMYVIEYEKLNAPLKKTNLDVELYENGILKSVNLKVEDRTKEVITQATRGITSLAMMYVQPASLLFPKAAEVTIGVSISDLNLCTAQVYAALEKVARLNREIVQTEKMIAGAKDAAARSAYEAELRGLREQIAEARKVLTLVQHHSLLPKFEDSERRFTVDRLSIDADAALSWFDQTALKELAGALTKYGVNSLVEQHKEHFKSWRYEEGKLKILGPEHHEFKVGFPLKDKVDLMAKWMYPKTVDVLANVVVEEHGTDGRSIPGKRAEIMSLQGLVYRQPVEGEVMMCHERSCLTESGKPEIVREARLFSRSFLIPQAGVLATLPLTNGVFDSNTIVASFSTAGTLVRLQYTSEAEAETAASAFAETAGAMTKIRVESTKAETERLEAETKRLDALKKKAEAEKALKKSMGLE